DVDAVHNAGCLSLLRPPAALVVRLTLAPARAAGVRIMKRLLLILTCITMGCRVGPNYSRPSAAAPHFKEPPPEGWKQAQPNDAFDKGRWWEMYNDPALNALEEQVNLSNQNVLQAEAVFRQARATIRQARSALFPTLTGSAGISESRAVTGG